MRRDKDFLLSIARKLRRLQCESIKRVILVKSIVEKRKDVQFGAWETDAEVTRYSALRYYEKHKEEIDEELQPVLNHIASRSFGRYNYPEAEVNYYGVNEVFFDENRSMHYVFVKGNRLYLKKSINSKILVQQTMNTLLYEQEPCSPHRYIDEKLSGLSGYSFVDVGAAEGLITLMYIDEIKDAYLFECEDEWVEALSATFEPWKDKVHIVKKYVSEKTEGKSISLDDYFITKMENDSKYFVKMDIEGMEETALRGATRLLSNIDTKVAICIYHNAEDEEKLARYLGEYDLWVSNGLIGRYGVTKPPFFTHGVLRGEKNSKYINE